MAVAGCGGLWLQDENGLSTMDYMVKWKCISWIAIGRYISSVAEGQPLLHGAIVNNVQPVVLKTIVKVMPWSVSVRDKNGRLPIDSYSCGTGRIELG